MRSERVLAEIGNQARAAFNAELDFSVVGELPVMIIFSVVPLILAYWADRLLRGLLAGARIISTAADVMLRNRLALIKHANVGAVR
jgi:hypothetical protein